MSESQPRKQETADDPEGESQQERTQTDVASETQSHARLRCYAREGQLSFTSEERKGPNIRGE